MNKQVLDTVVAPQRSCLYVKYLLRRRPIDSAMQCLVRVMSTLEILIVLIVQSTPSAILAHVTFIVSINLQKIMPNTLKN